MEFKTIPKLLAGMRGKLTRYAAAKICRIDPRTWYRWEAGKREPTLVVLQGVAIALGHTLVFRAAKK